jgi:hypothetical protein
MDALVIERLNIVREDPISMRSSKSQTGAASACPTPLDPPEQRDLGARPSDSLIECQNPAISRINKRTLLIEKLRTPRAPLK